MTKLRDISVLVVDCQATGATPEQGSLLEIGWSTARADTGAAPIVSSWVRPPAGTRISIWVRRLTGVEDEDLAGAIEPEEAWARLRDAFGPLADERGCVPVAIHFAHFELRFLRDLHARFGSGDFPLEVIDLHAVACRLYPNLPRRGLRALAGFLGHGTPLERRSAGHVEASAYVWRALVPKLEEAGVTTWGELRAWLAEPATKPKRTKRVFPMAKEKRRELPDAPGVYRFLRSNGDVLYVGKATSLKSRIAAHFSGAARTGERAMEMLTQVHSVDATRTATILEAALLECDEIKRRRPPYNQQLREVERAAWFASRDLSSSLEKPDAAHRVGPLPSRYALSGLGAVRALALGASIAEAPLRARAVEAPLWATPDAAVFEAAWRPFAQQLFPAGAAARPDAALARAAKLLAPTIKDEPSESELADHEWDPPRVRRHLDRAVVRGVHLVRRGRLLTLLSESAIAFREQEGEWRLLVLSGAEIVSQGDLQEEVPPAVRRVSRHERQVVFDGPRYDRLRVLATELTRVYKDTGDVRLWVRSRPIEGDRLARLL